MTLVISEDVYVYAIWFQSAPRRDWMGYISREGDGPFKVEYRFRYYADDKVFDSDDEKHFARVELPDAKEESAEGFLQLMRVLGTVGREQQGFSEMEIVYVRGRGIENFKEKTKDVPWMHMKHMKQEES